MARVEKTIFISYRRTNLPWALAIYQNLAYHGYDVFFDYESTKSGDFEQIILGNIRARAHFVVILTPSALERCDDPDDWLRREIEAAIDNKRNIVPLMLEGFNFGSPSIARYLTGKLELLKKYNGLNVPADYFEEAMGRLRDKYLNIALDAVLHPLSNTAGKVAKEQQVAASKATQVKQKELSSQEWFEQGYKHYEAQKYDDAIYAYTAAIDLKPSDAYANFNRGLAFLKKGEYDSAIQDFSRAVSLKPDYADAYYSLGLTYFNKGDFDRSIQYYGQAIGIKPQDPDAHYGRGLAYFNKGDLDKAIQDYSKSISLKPDYSQAFNNRGNAYYQKGDFAAADKDYTRSIQLNNPELHLPYHNRGNARKAKGELDEAIKDYNEALRLKPDYFDAYWSRGSTWFDKGEYNLSAADYQRYFDLGGTNEQVRTYLNDAKKKSKK